MSEDKRLQDAMKFFAELAADGGNIDTMEKLNYIRLCWNSAIDMQAEIEWLKKELRDNNYQAVRQIIPAEMAVDDLRVEIQRKDKLIEQMRVALAWLYQWTKNEVEHFGAASPDDEIIKDVEAALSAAERGE